MKLNITKVAKSYSLTQDCEDFKKFAIFCDFA